MAFTDRLAVLTGLMALLSNINGAQSLDMTFCASINTASGSGNSSTFQSDGLCQGFCVAEYAFSVIKDSECWCSNDEPDKSVQVDTTKCNQQCPGYPSDTCGGDGLWGYMSLNKQPSGTKGASSSTQTPSPDPITQTVHNTVTVTPTVHSTTAVPTAVPDKPDTSSDTATATPTVSVHTVTAGGTVSLQTVTVAPTSGSSASSDANSSGVTSSQHGLSTGAAVGVAIGVFAAVAVAIGACLFFWLRRRRQGQGGVLSESPGSHRGSSAGMMSTPTTAMASVWDGDNTSTGRRNSRFMPHDPRMDPYATNIYSRFENKSHESINTLQDNHDYSRKVLRTTNPDPDPADVERE